MGERMSSQAAFKRRCDAPQSIAPARFVARPRFVVAYRFARAPRIELAFGDFASLRGICRRRVG